MPESRVQSFVAWALSAHLILVFLLSPHLWLGSDFLPNVDLRGVFYRQGLSQSLFVCAIMVLTVLSPIIKRYWVYLVLALGLILSCILHIERFQEPVVFALLVLVLLTMHSLGYMDPDSFQKAIFIVSTLCALLKWAWCFHSGFSETLLPWLAQGLPESVKGIFLRPSLYYLIWPLGSIILLLFRKTRFFASVCLSLWHIVWFLLQGPLGINEYPILLPFYLFLPFLLFVSGPSAKLVPRDLLKVLIVVIPLIIYQRRYNSISTLVFSSVDGRFTESYIALEKYIAANLPSSLTSKLLPISAHSKWKFSLERQMNTEWGIPVLRDEWAQVPYKRWFETYARHPGDVFLIQVWGKEIQIKQN